MKGTLPSLTFDLKTYLAAKQKLVDQQLADLLARETKAPATLIDAMRYSLLAPGGIVAMPATSKCAPSSSLFTPMKARAGYLPGK